MTDTPPFEFAPAAAPVNSLCRRCPVPFENSSKRILIMRTGAHGDILMGTPLLFELRNAYPEAWITWIVERKERDAIDAHPCVDDVLLWSGNVWKRPLRTGLFPVWLFWAMRLWTVLRKRRYGIFLSFQPEEWPLLARGVGAQVSVGVFDTFRQFHGGRKTSRNTNLYTTVFAHPNLPEHRTDQYLLALRALGIGQPVEKKMSIGWTQDDEDFVATYLHERGISSNERIIVIAPRTTWPSRCWEGPRYAEFGEAMQQSMNVKVVLIGSLSEEQDVKAVARHFKQAPVVAAGAMTFRQVAALIARAALLVSGDTGPMHLAAAVNTPYLALFGPTPISGRAPLQGRGIALAHTVPCGPCDQKFCRNPVENHMLCMKLLTVAEVFDAAWTLLGEATSQA